VPDYSPDPAYQEEEEEQDFFRNGDVVNGVVDGIRPFGAFVKLNGTSTSGLLHISQISNQRVEVVEDVFEVGEEIKVLITRVERDGRISLNTRRLERNPGDIFTNKEAVWEGAEDMGQAVREEWAQRRAERREQYDGGRDRDDFRGRPRRDDGEGFRGRGRGGGGRGRGGGGRGGGRGSYNRDGDRRQRRDYDDTLLL
jgi:predicted RNA-binding protein with RPS1 domain